MRLDRREPEYTILKSQGCWTGSGPRDLGKVDPIPGLRNRLTETSLYACLGIDEV